MNGITDFTYITVNIKKDYIVCPSLMHLQPEHLGRMWVKGASKIFRGLIQ